MLRIGFRLFTFILAFVLGMLITFLITEQGIRRFNNGLEVVGLYLIGNKSEARSCQVKQVAVDGHATWMTCDEWIKQRESGADRRHL